MLNKRQKKIIRMLENSQSWMIGKKMAAMLGVSDRTVRSDIDHINREYPAPIIASDRHKGYYLIERVRVEGTKKETDIPQEPQERANYILKELLFHKKELNLYTLQEEVFVSEYSLENDLRRIRQILKPHAPLKLVRSKNHIRLDGSEDDKRKLYKALLEEETKGNFLSMDKLASLYHEIDLLKVKEILDETLTDFDFHVRGMMMPMLMMHIGICLERLLHHNYVSTDMKKEQFIGMQEYAIAEEFFQRVRKWSHIEVTEEEVLRLALLLMGKRSNRFIHEDVPAQMKGMTLEQIVGKLLERIYEQFLVDMRYDTDLKVGLQIHIQGLMERQRQGAQVVNVYLQETKKNYPLVFEMGICAGKFLSECSGLPITEDEAGLLALHLGSAYERSALGSRYQALMIYPDEQVLSRMCCQKIESRFAQRMDIAGYMNVFEKKKVVELNPDLIITTLPLQHDLPIPTVQVSLFFNSKDESALFYALNDLDRQKNHEEFEEFIKAMIYPDLFYIDHPAKQPEELITFLCREMKEKELIPEGFLESVLQRERFSPTSIVYGLAIPHALDVAAKRSCISVAILQEAIRWGAFDVSMVILLAIREEDKRLMKIFFDWLSSMVSDGEGFAKLLKVRDYAEFLSFLA